MNAALRENTIKRIERFGVKVDDSGAKSRPHYISGVGDLSDDELYLVASTLGMLATRGQLTDWQGRAVNGYATDAEAEVAK